MFIYIVKRPQGSYDDYREEIEKVFLDKEKAEKYMQEENKKLPLEQANRCKSCTWHYQVGSVKQGKKPDCLKGYSFGTCANYLQYRDVEPLFIEEYETEE